MYKIFQVQNIDNNLTIFYIKVKCIMKIKLHVRTNEIIHKIDEK